MTSIGQINKFIYIFRIALLFLFPNPLTIHCTINSPKNNKITYTEIVKKYVNLKILLHISMSIKFSGIHIQTLKN